ncbi:MAG: 2-hydroxyacid dehydrogenase [Candidatus Omnitrophica bacterium]|nr:2-hydroxyacid dehydrogenase [Candidatus Omnitrophota bacterium]
MKIAVFNTKRYDRQYLGEANEPHHHELVFLESHLTAETSRLGHGFEGICAFVNDELNRQVLTDLAKHGTRFIALRCAGFNHVDLAAAGDLGLTIARVPAYSPHGVAEHSVALMLTLSRKICRAYNRVRDGNFSLEGLLGFEFFEKTVGVIGTGAIGSKVVRIMKGFGCKVLAYDPYPNPDCVSLGAEYVSLKDIFKQSDILTLHVPLMPETYHMINAEALKFMKPGVMLINTSRGGLVDTNAVIEGLKSGQIGYLGLDVYEEEAHLFFEDLSGRVIQDDIFARLLTFPNVVITSHQAFFTHCALQNIAETTLQNITDFQKGKIPEKNLVSLEHVEKS